MGVSPCKYPKCADSNGDPELTPDGMCPGCQRRFTKLLGWLVMDWVNLVTNLPTPARRPQERIARGRQVFGHPAEWASDTAAEIATVLFWTQDSLAERLYEKQPPRPDISERIRVRAAWEYLECRIDRLARTDFAADVAVEFRDLHGLVRSRLGLTRPRQLLPTPCPSCELRTLYRMVDFRHDSIECGNCSHVIREEHYPFYTRMVLDTILDVAA